MSYITAFGFSYLLLAVPQFLPAQEEPFPSREVELDIDSGPLTNAGSEARVVWSTTVDLPDASWLRLHFGTVELARDDAHGTSSMVRLTSLADSAVQHLDALTCAQWGNSTAYFNGGRLLVEMIAIPGGSVNRLVISGASAGKPGEGTILSICDDTDDRIPSATQRDCRVMPNGCTAFIIDDAHYQFLTAGHCADYPGDLQVVEFNVPLSLGDGEIVHPGPEDQYAVDQASRQSTNQGEGLDWAYFGCFPNTETGLTPFLAGGGEFYVLADSAPPVGGQTIRVTGYGTVIPPVPPEWNLTQKEHAGPYWDLAGTVVQYRVDTTGGNSGSAVFDEDSGQVIGIHTHGGCDTGGGANIGTAVHNGELAAALANPLGVCAPFGLSVTNLVGGQTAIITASGATPGARVYFGYSLSGPGELPIDALGVILGISDPRLVGWDIAGPFGRASIERHVSPGATGHRVWIQAAQRGLTSIVVEQVVQ
jgi:V8-like Glu-specific endopeptidase